MSLKSINELKHYIKYELVVSRSSKAKLLNMLDEVESEIEDFYIPAPLDANDVPVKLNHTLLGHYIEGKPIITVKRMMYGPNGWVVSPNDVEWSSPGLYVHYSLTDLLHAYKAAVDDIENKYDSNSEVYNVKKQEIDKLYETKITELIQ